MARNVLNNMQVIALHKWMETNYPGEKLLENYNAYALDASNALGFVVGDGHINRMRQDMGLPSLAEARTQREEQAKQRDKELLEASGQLAATVLAQQVELDALKERLLLIEGFVNTTFPQYMRQLKREGYMQQAPGTTLGNSIAPTPDIPPYGQ